MIDVAHMPVLLVIVEEVSPESDSMQFILRKASQVIS